MLRDDDALECECIEIELDLIRLRLDVEKLRYELKTYDPNQLRVPKGQPEGGQWTKVGGGAGEPSQASERGKYAPQLQNDPYINQHIYFDHVRLTDGELIERVRQGTIRGPVHTAIRDRHGTFESVESARDLIRRTLDNNREAVAGVVSGRSIDAFVTWRFGYPTGREAAMEPIGSAIRLRSTHGVGVYIRHDPTSELGYRVHTAYPRNFNPRTGR